MRACVRACVRGCVWVGVCQARLRGASKAVRVAILHRGYVVGDDPSQPTARNVSACVVDQVRRVTDLVQTILATDRSVSSRMDVCLSWQDPGSPSVAAAIDLLDRDLSDGSA